MSEHTPGPWHYALEGSTAAYIVERDGTTVVKLRVPENSTAHSSLAANARLIASAPDLLDVLNAMLTHMGRDEDEWNKATFDRARAAIKRATKGTA